MMRRAILKISELVRELKPRNIGIAGHVHPDGDCIGSCTSLYLYLKKAHPEITDVALYLEEIKGELKNLPGYGRSVHEEDDRVFDLFITCDVSEIERIGVAKELFGKAVNTICIDHHVTNPGFADTNIVDAEAGSCAEVLCEMYDRQFMDRDIASCLYTGMIHDTGVFQYQNTRPKTLRLAADLLEYGIDFSSIIDRSFNERTFVQSRIMGYTLNKAQLYHSGKTAAVTLSISEMKEYGATLEDLDMIVSQLRFIEGVEAAIFAYEVSDGYWKLSMRSKSVLDVSKACAVFGGGGHVRAAGCNMSGDEKQVLDGALAVIGEML